MSTIASLTLTSGDARATILPGVGANVTEWSIGDWRILSSPDSAEALAKSPARAGVPILFPFPNRIKGGRYAYRGVSHEWSPKDAEGNAKHGFVLREPWDVVDSAVDRATMRIAVSTRPHLLAMYPFPCTIAWSVTLGPREIGFEVCIENTGSTDMPIGFGIHPYFAIPLSPKGSRATTVVQVPAREAWALEAMIPTGARAPATGKLALASGRALGGDAYDHVLTGLDGDAASIADPASGRRIRIEAARKDGFHDWVVYVPADRDVVALEPYTCTTDALNLAAQGVDGTGLIVLAPAAVWRARISFHAEL